MRNLDSSRQIRSLLAVAAVSVLMLVGASSAQAQGRYKPGDRVECNVIGSTAPQYAKNYEKGTVMEFRPNDQPDGSWYRVKADSNKVEYYCKIEVIRPIAGSRPAQDGGTPTAAANRTKDAELLTEGDFVSCPIRQKPVKNGARPDAELFKKIIRCAKREKSVEEGDEGAVKVDIADLRIGASRPWSYRQDQGNGKAGTLVYPVKATYTVSTFYRTATEIEEGWIRILNFYVNAFGEWAIGSEENVKSPKVQRIQK